MTKTDFRVMVLRTGQRGKLVSTDYRTPIVKLDSNGAKVRLRWSEFVSFINEPPLPENRSVLGGPVEVVEVSEDGCYSVRSGVQVLEASSQDGPE